MKCYEEMKRQTIDKYFAPKKSKQTENIQTHPTVSQDASAHTAAEIDTGSPSPGPSSSTPKASNANDLVELSISNTSVDIGVVSDKIYCYNSSKIPPSKELMHKALTDLFVPDDTFVFPSTQCNKKNLKFQKHWLGRWPWLAYSKSKDGAFCKYCVVFGKEYVGKGTHQKMGTLVAAPFTKWKDAIDRFNDHNHAPYHRFSEEAAKNFLKTISGKQEDVATMLNQQIAKDREKNRQALTPIIETIIFCGENEVPLRGHRDSGPLL